jgi:serine/threonine-protein kinase
MDVTPATWSALSKLLDELLDLEPAARAGWIDGINATQPELAPKLRRLLAAHEQPESGDILQDLPQLEGSTPRTAAAGLASGVRIGPYRLKREIASGGMADVWLAGRADGAFERDVALKLPRLSRLRRDIEARFARERDILARLEHPHIARFYDAGVTDDGLPWLAMEYVHGQSITSWCDHHKLTVAVRIGLFVQVLEAVQFAHSNLVVHRDLKPSNVLVTHDGQVRLLDFGIAKLLAEGDIARETQLTQLAGRALTLNYASPEQIKGEPLTIATDVYSLGVVLYELLTGRPPYRLTLQSAAQLELAIVGAEPAKPSGVVCAEAAQLRSMSDKRLTRSLRGDLDTIVLKALAKQPARRYATVAELADDLRRHLAGQPVRAQPASWAYRAGKFVTRNRVAVAAGATICVALAAAAGISVWQARVAQRQATRAEEVKRFVLSFFDATDPSSGGKPQATVVDLLMQARMRLDATHIEDDSIRAEVLGTVGGALQGLGESEQARPVLAEAARLASALPHSQDQIAARIHLSYGHLLWRRGNLDLALEQLDAAEERSRRASDTALLAGALAGKAELSGQLGQYDRAIDLDRQAVRILERDPAAGGKEWLMVLYADIAAFMDRAMRKGALEPARRSMELAADLQAEHPNPTVLAVRTNNALALAHERDPQAALAELREIQRVEIDVLGADHRQVAATLRAIGLVSLLLGDTNSAIESLQEALRISLAKSEGKPTAPLAASRLDYGIVLADARRFDQALNEWREADAAYSSLYGADSSAARLARSGIALALTRLGRLDEADALVDRTGAGPFGSAGEEAIIKGRMGLLRSAQGRHDEAIALLSGAVDFLAEAPSKWTVALAYADLGNALLAAGRVEESLGMLEKAQSHLLESQLNGSPDLADVDVDIARARIALGHPDQAVAPAREAAEFWSRFAPDHRNTGVALLWQSRALAATGNVAEAAGAMRRAAAILATAGLPVDQAAVTQMQDQDFH